VDFTCAQPINCLFPVPQLYTHILGFVMTLKKAPYMETITIHTFTHTSISASVRPSSVSVHKLFNKKLSGVWPHDILYLWAWMNIYLYSPQFLSTMDEIQYRPPWDAVKQISFMKISAGKAILYWTAYTKFYLHHLHFYQTWIKFSTGDVPKTEWLFHKN
jgi:hypothetical protein